MINTDRERFRKYTDPAEFERLVDMDSVSEMWQRSVRDYPDVIAIEDNGNQYTYAQIDADVSRFRSLIKREDKTRRVGIYCPNSYDFVRAYLAVTTLGYTAVILPPQLDGVTVFGCVMKFGIDMLIYHSALKENTAFLSEKRPDVTLIKSDSQGETDTDMVFPSRDTPCVIMFTGGTTGKSKGALLSNSAVMQGTSFADVIDSCYGSDKCRT